jgi:lactate racemase-like protein
MKTSIVFGDGWLDVTLPDGTREASTSLNVKVPPVADLDETLAAALASPLGGPTLRERARGARAVTIAFDDPTVPCFVPVWEKAIDHVLAELSAAGVGADSVRLLCANALHRKFTEKELAGILGSRLVAQFQGRIGCHDAEDHDNLVYLGTTPSGYDVEVNRAVADSDVLVYVNASAFRGFHGGWKSVCVGLSTWRSIRWHHTPDRMTMSVDRSAMHEILDEMGALVEERLGAHRVFKIETLLANPMQVGRVWAGSVGATRRAAVAAIRTSTPSRRDLLPEKADVVVYGVPAWSPYAAYARMNPLLTLLSTGLGYLGGVINALGKPGCSVVLATPCPDGWDEQHHPSYRETWERILPQCRAEPADGLAYADELRARPEYVEAYRDGFGFHAVHPLMGLFGLVRLKHAARVIVAGIQDPALARHAGLEATGSVEEAVDLARAAHGPSASVALVRYPPAFNRQ